MSDIDDEQKELDEFLDNTISALRAAAGDMGRIEEAIRDYCQRGRELEMSPMELWDYFTISYPGLPQQAGYDQEQIDQIDQRFERITNELWS